MQRTGWRTPGLSDPDKKAYYVKEAEMFYDYCQPAFDSGEVARHEVPYEDIFLPVMEAKAKRDEMTKSSNRSPDPEKKSITNPGCSCSPYFVKT